MHPNWILPEAAEYLRMSQNTLKGLCRLRKIPSAKVGGKWIFRQAKLDEWLAKKEGR